MQEAHKGRNRDWGMLAGAGIPLLLLHPPDRDGCRASRPMHRTSKIPKASPCIHAYRAARARAVHSLLFVIGIVRTGNSSL